MGVFRVKKGGNFKKPVVSTVDKKLGGDIKSYVTGGGEKTLP